MIVISSSNSRSSLNFQYNLTQFWNNCQKALIWAGEYNFIRHFPLSMQFLFVTICNSKTNNRWFLLNIIIAYQTTAAQLRWTRIDFGNFNLGSAWWYVHLTCWIQLNSTFLSHFCSQYTTKDIIYISKIKKRVRCRSRGNSLPIS